MGLDVIDAGRLALVDLECDRSCYDIASMDGRGIHAFTTSLVAAAAGAAVDAVDS